MQKINLHKNKEMCDIREDKEIALLQRFKDTREKSIKCVGRPWPKFELYSDFPYCGLNYPEVLAVTKIIQD